MCALQGLEGEQGENGQKGEKGLQGPQVSSCTIFSLGNSLFKTVVYGHPFSYSTNVYNSVLYIMYVFVCF